MKHSESMICFFDSILNEKKCYELARNKKFIMRSSSKLRGHEFIKAMIIPSEGLSTDSLKGLCMRIKEFNPEADLSAQALCERINDISAKELMKGVYALILSYVHSSITDDSTKLKSLEQFKSVLIEDSTVVRLDEELQEIFKGTNRGGTGAKSQVKIDLIYDLMKGTMLNAEIYNGNEPDQALASRIIRFIKEGDLVIRDQGYFVLGIFKKIIEVNAFFISRLVPHVKIYLNKDDLEPIDLGRYLEKHYSNYSVIDIAQIYLGDEKIPSRLILYRLPKEVVKVRLRGANKQAQARGRKMSRGKKVLLQFAVFVTNVTKELLPAETIGTVYRLRWEIELIFKRWKSQLKIDYLKGINSNRIECLIWSRLCSILVTEIISGFIAKVAKKICSDLEISHVKIINYILRQSKLCRDVARNQLENFLEETKKNIPRMLVKDKRKRKTMRERVMECENYYDVQPSDYQKVA